MHIPDSKELLKKAKKKAVELQNEKLLEACHSSIKELHKSGFNIKEVQAFLSENGVDLGFNTLRDYINEKIKQKEKPKGGDKPEDNPGSSTANDGRGSAGIGQTTTETAGKHSPGVDLSHGISGSLS